VGCPDRRIDRRCITRGRFWGWWYLSIRRHSDILRDRSAAWSRS
jgi:hypothetical protein